MVNHISQEPDSDGQYRPYTIAHTTPLKGLERMTTGAAPRRTQLTLVVGITSSALEMKGCHACGKSEGRTLDLKRAVAAMPFTAARNRAGTRSRLEPEC